MGEITPLPGYGPETPESVVRNLHRLEKAMGDWKGPFLSFVRDLWWDAPFTASGIACAYETWLEDIETAYFLPLEKSIPLVALCEGNTAEECYRRAVELVEQGFRTLKMKIGIRGPSEEIGLVRAASKGAGLLCKLRLDANQALSMADAMFICGKIEDLENLELLEQPFKPDRWKEHEQLALFTSVPIMLDESIWNEDDVRRASDCGAYFVKLKLCKHLGMAGSRRLADYAESLGLAVVYGNGVQTSLGNHLEARIFLEKDLTRASESNGFLKPQYQPFDKGLKVEGGMLISKGLKCSHLPLQDEAMLLRVNLDEDL
ncbi:MAG: hypothetical protein JRI22_20835 [Deltaproteobacteria bacterium]|nr:hypothetical protein [Deltaproteobacteria bacterium]